MRIYLVGYMYSGKTTMGRQLARRLDYTFHDLDVAFEHRYRCSIPLFFQQYGEEAFRQLERQMLQRTASLENTVVSTGGGTPCFFDNMEFINSNGLSIYLQMSEDALIARMVKSKKTRPTFAHMSEEERRTKLSKQLQQRIPFYQQAQLTVNAFNPDINSIAQTILDKMHDVQ